MGKYYNKLHTIFIILAVLVVSVPMSIISVSSSVYQKEQYQNELQKSMSAQAMLAQNGLNTVTTMLNNLLNNTAIENWSASKSSAEYYYNSILAFQQIRKINSDPSLVECELAVTLPDDDSFVISGKGTNTKELYFRTETSLSKEQQDYIFEYFRKSKGVIVLPVYSEGNLKELYYILRQTMNYRDIIYIVKLPYKTVFGNNNEQKFIILNNDQIIAYSSNREKDKELYTQVYNELVSKGDISGVEGLQKVKNKLIYVGSFPNIGWNIVYINDVLDINLFQIALYILFFTVLIILSVLFSNFITNRLYQPIKSVISEISAEPSDKTIDEFNIIKQNTNKIKALSNELQTALFEKEAILKQRYYRDVLLGLSADQNIYKELQIPEGNYCVALIEFQSANEEQAENRIFLLKNTIYAYTQEHPNLYYISLSYYSCALIIRADIMSDARKVVLDAINQADKQIKIKASVSDIHSGTLNINNCYKEALQVLEYKYLYDNNKILTMEQIDDMDLTTYNYPLITENQLIQYVVEGRNEGIEIFKELIKENIQFRNLSPGTLKNFIFSVIGTLGRIFQELKTSPQQLLGEDIDFEELYNMWNNSTIISQLQKIFESIIESINLKNSLAGDKLLSEMLDYIHKNYSDDIMLIDLANEFNISTKYCSALFKKLKDDNFKNYLNKYRVEKAQEFIKKDADIKISDLSRMVGFNSSNSFIRVFSRYTGMTPKAFAEKVTKQ